MKTQISLIQKTSQAVRVRKTGNDLRETVQNKRPPGFWWVLIGLVVMLILPLPGLAQSKQGSGDHGSGHEGGGGGCGDVFGDLFHILRDEQTGQPVFAQRWIELPASEPGYGWGYCPIAVYEVEKNSYEKDKDKNVSIPIGFLPYSCDPDPADADLIVEVDYFGRLNGGRTKERNNRMHFDEVISNIKQAGRLDLDPAGRLMMGFECVADGDCLWTTVDSPMESMSLYTRLMKYGHFATDPKEVDTWAHGDPALPTQYHPALTESDFDKFIDAGLAHLLPARNCWSSTGFRAICANPEALEREDFNSSSVYLAAAANKTGKITIDLVQYLNRFLKITQTTETTESTLNTLPALYFDCWKSEIDPADPVEGEVPVDPEYDENCDIVVANPDETPNYDLFTNVQEQFVSFLESSYKRKDRSDASADLILESLTIQDHWVRYDDASLEDWVYSVNGKDVDNKDIANFVDAASDALRTIEYIHNYAIPENLYCKYEISEYCTIE